MLGGAVGQETREDALVGKASRESDLLGFLVAHCFPDVYSSPAP